MGNCNEIEWVSTHGEVNESEALKVESLWGIVFPEDFKRCIVKNHGGHPSKDNLEIPGYDEVVFNRLLSMDSTKKTYIVNVYSWIFDRLPENVYPFADDPFGNYFCFDYRNGKDMPPEIVFWDHESEEEEPEKTIIPICNTFTELLSMLYAD